MNRQLRRTQNVKTIKKKTDSIIQPTQKLTTQSDFIYEETLDWRYISQYFKLRTDTYNKECETKLKGLLNQGQVDYTDYDSEFFVVRQADKCIGGSRLVISKPNQSKKLPLEGDVFNLKDILPELNLESVAYGESGRTVVNPDYRHKDHPTKLFQLTVESAVNKHNCRYLFGVAPLSQARLYRILYNSLGGETVIREDIVLPEKPTDEGKRMYLVCVDLINLHYTKQPLPSLHNAEQPHYNPNPLSVQYL